MREIIFRGKGRDDGKWYEGDLGTVAHKRFIDDGKHNARVIPEAVGQFTGLTDINGKRIFEGDIVKCRHHWQLRVYPRDGIDEEEFFFSQKIRGAYGKSVDRENIFIPCERFYYFRNYAVEYFANNGGFRIRNGGQFHELTRRWIFNRSLEVIGNIHDNPELMKEAE